MLDTGDAVALDGFLAARAATSMFLRAALRDEGIVDRGADLQATFVGCFEGGSLQAVAAHFGNGGLHLQAPIRTVDVACAAVAATGRPVRALLGPWEQVEAVEPVLAPGPPSDRSRETLLALSIAELIVPAPLSQGQARCRRATMDDLPFLIGWRIAYRIAVNAAGPGVAERARNDMTRLIGRGDVFLLEVGRDPVACCTFNARTADMVQIGGVWTPPDLRGRGYARAVVAGALQAARSDGVAGSVLFTDESNDAARRAYLALGYRQVGLFGSILYWW